VSVSVIEIETPHGPARAHVHASAGARGVLVLGHGAGGGIAAADLQASRAVALGLGLAVVLVEQPYRVAGRRSAAPARQLDAAWLAVIADLQSPRHPELGADRLPLIVGGRSSGARVACRTAADAQAVGVLCLAFPVHPPGKADDPAKSRMPELDAVAVPVLVVQGERDPFGRPGEGPDRAVVVVPGDHALRNQAAVSAAIEPWLMTLTAAYTA
jgi:predicted alpha/beta-hydrolase family hydrolase